jgi:hypothetical protein
MAERTHRADGFHLVAGLLGVATGPVLLMRGAPAGWSFMLIAAGLVILATQWAIVYDVHFEMNDPAKIALAVAGMACVAVAVVYLTRAADDLPSLFPGHDGDSEHFRILPGTLSLMLGLVVFGRAVASMRPARATP